MGVPHWEGDTLVREQKSEIRKQHSNSSAHTRTLKTARVCAFIKVLKVPVLKLCTEETTSLQQNNNTYLWAREPEDKQVANKVTRIQKSTLQMRVPQPCRPIFQKICLASIRHV